MNTLPVKYTMQMYALKNDEPIFFIATISARDHPSDRRTCNDFRRSTALIHAQHQRTLLLLVRPAKRKNFTYAVLGKDKLCFVVYKYYT